MKKYLFLLVFGFVSILGLSATTAYSWVGDYHFTESCNDNGKIDVTASYTPAISDGRPGTVVYTSPYTDLKMGDIVKVQLVEDQYKKGNYTVSNKECLPPVIIIDVCFNIDGNQENVPEGMVVSEDKLCTLIPVEVIDVCLNIEGNQESVPEGMEVSGDKECATPTSTRRSSGSIPSIIASTVIAEEVAPIPAVVGKVLGAETAVLEVIVPKLPKTGFPDQNTQPWYMEILSVFLKLIK